LLLTFILISSYTMVPQIVTMESISIAVEASRMMQGFVEGNSFNEVYISMY
jgi:hypothetical protein